MAETKITDDLDVFKDIYFNAKNPRMEKNIGMKCMFKNPKCEAERDVFEVVAIQFNYAKEIVYRVVGKTDVHKFGRCAEEDEVEWVQ